jgi:hypothetical protein
MPVNQRWCASLNETTFVIPNRAESPVRACPELAEGNLLLASRALKMTVFSPIPNPHENPFP